LFATNRALAALPVGKKIDLYTDSQYVVTCANKARSWRQQQWHGNNGVISNHDLVNELLTLCEHRHVNFYKVRGHTGNYFNEVVDYEANRQAAQGLAGICA
jgi:ribonuclease HI